MKFYQYWVRVERPLQIEGVTVMSKFLGKSNTSREQAVQEAIARAQKVQQRLDGRGEKGREDYSEDIQEEVTQEIDRNNVVTRTRYGARILNTTSLTLLDIDQYPRSFWELLGFKAKKPEKEGILAHLEQKVVPLYPRLGFRLYETAKGIRAIVLGDYVDPAKPEARVLMKQTHTDPLYALLCIRQKCYRARLTPKPSRMKMKGFKYQWPLDEAMIEPARKWVEVYEAEAAKFSTCKYLKTLGRDAALSSLIRFHDQVTGAMENRKLA